MEGSEKEIVTEQLSYEEDNQKWKHTAEEKKLLRKINNTVLPTVFFIIFIQFCDKSALSVAAVLGMTDEIAMDDDQYSWLGSIFYLGYLVCQAPNYYLIRRIPIGRYLGGALVLWGICMGSTAACHTYPQLLGVRVLLGLFEGVTYPCLYILLNTLYRRSEQPAVWGFFGIGTGMGTVLGVVIAYGLAHMEGIHGLRAWRWAYLVFGIATVVIGICTYFFLADTPDHWLFRLTEVEYEIVEERTRDNNVVRVRDIKNSQVWEAVKEPRFWILCLAICLNTLQNGGLVTYSTILVQNLGFSSFMAIILQIPSGVAAAIAAISSVLIAKRLNRIVFTGIAVTILSFLGCLLMIVVPGAGKLAGYYISWTMTGTGAILTTLTSNNVSGYTKKTFYNGAVVVAMTIGNFCGPLMMTGNQAPYYTGSMIGYVVANLVIVICFVLLYIIMLRENKRRLANPPETKSDPHLDLTDKEDRNILYIL